MKIWNLVGGVWVVTDSVVLTAAVISAIRKIPRLQLFVQPARSDNDFEIVVANTTRRRVKIKKAWVELSDSYQVFPAKGWENMNISLDSGESMVIKVPFKPISKQIADRPTKSNIRFIGLLDDNGKLRKVKIPKGIKEKLAA